MLVWVAGLAVGVAVLAAWPVTGQRLLLSDGPFAGRLDSTDPAPERDDGLLRRFRLVWAVLAGAGAWAFLGGPLGVAAGAATSCGAWVVIGRSEPPSVVRRRAAVRADLPHVVTLLAVALRSGAAPGEAVALVCRALPGPATEGLALTSSRLHLGASPVEVWDDLARDVSLAPLARTMARAMRSGAPVEAVVERLADDLSAAARASVEDRARAVGVKAAVPLGLCLLPSFLLLGIAPLVAGLLADLAW